MKLDVFIGINYRILAMMQIIAIVFVLGRFWLLNLCNRKRREK